MDSNNPYHQVIYQFMFQLLERRAPLEGKKGRKNWRKQWKRFNKYTELYPEITDQVIQDYKYSKF